MTDDERELIARATRPSCELAKRLIAKHAAAGRHAVADDLRDLLAEIIKPLSRVSE